MHSSMQGDSNNVYKILFERIMANNIQPNKEIQSSKRHSSVKHSFQLLEVIYEIVY